MSEARSCPGCAGDGLYRSGTRTVWRAAVAGDGRLVRESVAVQRYRCRACGRSSADALDDADVVEAMGESAIRFGIVGAAARLGVDPGTVARNLSRWIGARRDEADETLPDAVAVNPVRSGQPLRLMLSDPSEEGILEIVDGISGLKAFAGRSGTVPSLVSVEVDAALVAAVRELWPAAVVAVPPAAAVRAVSAAALSSFRTLVRAGVAQGRNFRERAHLLRISDADLAEEQQDELKAWSGAARRFRAAVLLLLDALRTAGPAAFAEALARVQAALREVAPGGALEALLTTWRPEIAAGVENRWLDRAWSAVDALRREVVAVRPSAGLDMLRAILVFSVPRNVLPVPTPSYAATTGTARGARPIAGAMDALLDLRQRGARPAPADGEGLR